MGGGSLYVCCAICVWIQVCAFPSMCVDGSPCLLPSDKVSYLPSHRPELLAYKLPEILYVPPILLKEPWDYRQFLYEFWELELTFEAGSSPTEPYPSLALLLCRVLLGCLVWPWTLKVEHSSQVSPLSSWDYRCKPGCNSLKLLSRRRWEHVCLVMDNFLRGRAKNWKVLSSAAWCQECLPASARLSCPSGTRLSADFPRSSKSRRKETSSQELLCKGPHRGKWVTLEFIITKDFLIHKNVPFYHVLFCNAPQ